MSTAKPVVWQERQQLSTSEWTHWYSIPTPLPGLSIEGTTVSGIRYEWRALVLESDYLAERKAREAAEAEVARLNRWADGMSASRYPTPRGCGSPT